MTIDELIELAQDAREDLGGDAQVRIAYLAGLPPIRLHDLRHGAATLLLAAGHDMKVVQETLGLSSITTAADTYTSVLPQLAHQSAEDVAALLSRATLTGQIEASQQASGDA